MLAGGPIVGGALAVAAFAVMRDEGPAMHPLEVKESDGIVMRGLKHTVNGGATALTYGLAFLTGACGLTAGAAVYGALIGFDTGIQIPKNQT